LLVDDGLIFVLYRPSKSRSSDDDEAYTGDLLSYDDLFAWAQEKCNPLVRYLPGSCLQGLPFGEWGKLIYPFFSETQLDLCVLFCEG
jgi:hypothetical protein